MKTVYEVVYFSKDGNFYDTNLEYKDKDLAIEGVNLKVGNWNKYDTEFIQLYESVYNESDERISTELIYELKVS